MLRCRSKLHERQCPRRCECCTDCHKCLGLAAHHLIGREISCLHPAEDTTTHRSEPYVRMLGHGGAPSDCESRQSTALGSSPVCHSLYCKQCPGVRQLAIWRSNSMMTVWAPGPSAARVHPSLPLMAADWTYPPYFPV